MKELRPWKAFCLAHASRNLRPLSELLTLTRFVRTSDFLQSESRRAETRSQLFQTHGDLKIASWGFSIGIRPPPLYILHDHGRLSYPMSNQTFFTSTYPFYPIFLISCCLTHLIPKFDSILGEPWHACPDGSS